MCHKGFEIHAIKSADQLGKHRIRCFLWLVQHPTAPAKRSARISNRVLDLFELCVDVLPTRAETSGFDKTRILANSLESKQLFREDEVLVLEDELIGLVCRSGAMM
ncbi:hypothetical protein PG984_000038 [Apiospora sp. TS-2023a]